MSVDLGIKLRDKLRDNGKLRDRGHKEKENREKNFSPEQEQSPCTYRKISMINMMKFASEQDGQERRFL